jgi:uncharacterized ferredoxin-like protein
MGKDEDMSFLRAKDLEERAVRDVAAMMVAAARTAPKANGVDDIDAAVLDGDDLESLARAMDDLAQQKPSPYPASAFRSNGDQVRRSNVVVLIGVRGSRQDIEKPLDCGACGFGSCAALSNSGRNQGEDFIGPTCMLKALDLGIAIGSAVSLAGDFHLDNRIMYTIGAAAQSMGLLEADVVMGIPLSVTGKNPYFHSGRSSALLTPEELETA